MMTDNEIRAVWSSLIDVPHTTLRVLRDPENAEIHLIADVSGIGVAAKSGVRCGQTTASDDDSISANLKELAQSVRTSIDGAEHFLVHAPWAGQIPDWVNKPTKRAKKWA